ncbi:MAG TPA: prephenate dehydratase [Chthonomonadales bacterium]|nr:prephenate dehydratase [Chthonomonadales bacterium]
MNLSELRKEIDRIDEKIVELLGRRAALAQEIGQHKTRARTPHFTPEREHAIMKRLLALERGPLGAAAVRAIYREIISASLALEKPLTVSYLGPVGTFSHQAAIQKFGSSAGFAPADSIADIFAQTERGVADYGIAPLENSLAGAVPETLDTFTSSNLRVVSEVFVPIVHNLATHAERLEDVRTVYSHAQPFGQCRQWMRSHLAGVATVEVSSTARAAETAANEGGSSAAICPALAAEIHNLPILFAHIEDNPSNRTRFVVLGYNEPEPTGKDKTSIMFSVRNRPGELFRAMAAFEKYDVNLTMIESRPARVSTWEYVFYVDAQGHIRDPHVSKAVNQLRDHALFVTVLGAYPAAE